MSTNPDMEAQVTKEAAELAAPLDPEDNVRELNVVRYNSDPSVRDFRPIKGDPDEPGEVVSEVIDELGKDGTDSAQESASSPDEQPSTAPPASTTGVQPPATLGSGLVVPKSNAPS